ncbi:MAG: hypothetical protein AAF899_08250 [Pseudomonadota bacterium]
MTGDVAGGLAGIDADTELGDIDINALGVTGATADGVNAYTEAGAVYVNTQGAVVGASGYYGVYARSAGAGDVTVINSQSVTGGEAGIYAYTNAGNILIDAADVYANDPSGTAILAYTPGTGDVIITADSVSNTADTTSYDTVVQGNGGRIFVLHRETGSIDVDSTGITLDAGDAGYAAIYAKTYGANDDNYNDGRVDVDVSGPILTTGAGSDGVYGYGDYVSVYVSDTVTIQGGDASGIYAVSSGLSGYSGAVVQFEGDVSVTGPNTSGGAETQVGVGAVAVSGNVNVYSTGGASVAVTGDDTAGIIAASYNAAPAGAIYGAQSVSVTTAGTVTTDGTNGYGVVAINGGGDTTVDVAGVYTTGDNADGILAISGVYNGTGGVSITTPTITTNGAAADGVRAYAFGTDITIDVVDVTAPGAGSVGIYASAADGYDAYYDATVPGGDVIITANDVVSDATYDVVARSDGGRVDVEVNTGAISAYITGVTTDGDGEHAINAFVATPGPTDYVYALATGPIVTNGANAYGVRAVGGGSVTVITDAITTNGLASKGVYADAYGTPGTAPASVDVTVNGPIVAVGDGIEARTNYGSIDIDAQDITTTGPDADGIYAAVTGFYGTYGTLAIDTTGDLISVSGTGSRGIYARNYDGSVVITTDDVTSVSETAIDAYAYRGDVFITGGTMSGGTLYDVYAQAYYGRIGVDIEGGSVNALGNYIYSYDDGIAGISVSTGTVGAEGRVVVNAVDITTNATGADGVYVFGGTPVYVNVQNIYTDGDSSDGIELISNSGAGGRGRIEVSANYVYTTGASSSGIDITAEDGAVYLGATYVYTDGDSSPGISVTIGEGDEGGVLSYTDIDAVRVNTEGSGSDAVSVDAASGDVNVDVPYIYTYGDGAKGVDIAVSADGGNYAAVYVNTPVIVSTTGASADGIEIDNEAGSVYVDANVVETTGYDADGIEVDATGYVSVLAQYVYTDGDNAAGITVEGDGDVYVFNQTVETAGATATGIDATGQYAVTVYTANVTTTGPDADGIVATSVEGDVYVSALNVSATGTGSTGIVVTADENARVFANDVVSDATYDVQVSSNSGYIDVFVNSGSVYASSGGTTQGGYDGVSIYTGAGDVYVLVDGEIYTDSNFGVYIDSTPDSQNTIVVTAAGGIDAPSGYSIYSVEGEDTVRVFGDLDGTSILNGGADTVTFYGQDNLDGLLGIDAGTSTTDGVEDVDVLTFENVRGGGTREVASIVEIPAGGLENFERVVISGTSLIGFDADYGQTLTTTGSTDGSFAGGVVLENIGTLNLEDGDAIVGDVTVGNFATVVANGDGLDELETGDGEVTVTGSLSLEGTLDLQEQALGGTTPEFGGADDTVIFASATGNPASLLSDGGTIALDVEFNGSDVVRSDSVLFEPLVEGFGGTLTGDLIIAVEPTATTDLASGDPVTLIGVAPESTGTFQLAEPLFIAGSFLTPTLTETDGIVLEATEGLTAEIAGVIAASDAYYIINKNFFGDLATRIGSGDALYRPGLTGATAGIWGRFSVNGFSYESGEDILTTDSDGVNSFAQLGADVARFELGGGEVVASIIAQFGSINADVSVSDALSVSALAVDTDFTIRSYGGGAGVTYYGPGTSFYVDATAMVLGHDGEIGGVDFDNMSFSAGLEAGTRVPVFDTVSVVPKAQVVYHHTSEIEDGPELAVGSIDTIDIVGDDIESLEARLGAAVEVGSNTGQSLQVGTTLGYEFLAESETSFGGVDVVSDQGGLNVEAMMRGSADLGMATLFGEIRYKTDLDSDVNSQEIGGSVGIRVDF